MYKKQHMVEKPRIIDLPKILDSRGNLSFIESEQHIPFKIKRAHWIYDVPGGQTRGGHAYVKTKEFIVAMSGSFDVILDDSDGKRTVSLNRSYYGLYVPAGTWRELCNFSSNSLALILSSTYFDETDYIDNYGVYQAGVFHNQINGRVEVERIENFLNYDSKYTKVFDCSVLHLDKHASELGNLSVVENNRTIPFDVKRAYYLYDIPGGQSRGAHAHRKLQQFIISVGGSFDITLDDGQNKRTFTLNRPYYGLLIPYGIWRDLVNFSGGATCLVLASEHYDVEDYIRNYDEFLKYKGIKND